MHRLCTPHHWPSIIIFRKVQSSVAHAVQKHQIPTVFQTNPPRNNVSIFDIQDAMEASIKMKPCEKKDYFYAQGIDYNNVFKYYTIVIMLMKLYQKKM